VYVAEQTEPMRRRVALKVIKLGMDTKAVIARFEAERQAAGGLSFADGHPEIQKWLDSRTKPPFTPDVHLNTIPTSSAGNRDVLWLQERTTGRK
jgi:hypothetical protein